MSGPALAPSEIVVLRGGEFVPQGPTKGAAARLPSGASVDAELLADTALAAAFLADEQACVMRLSVRVTKKSLFKTLRGLFSDLGDTPAAWPGETLEAKLVAAQGPRSFTSVRYLTLQWLGGETSNPWMSAVDRIHSGLAARGLLKVQEGQGDAAVRSFVPSDALAEALAEHPAEPVKRLLSDCEQQRPDVWKMLTHDVHEGVESRRTRARRDPRLDRLAEIGREMASD